MGEVEWSASSSETNPMLGIGRQSKRQSIGIMLGLSRPTLAARGRGCGWEGARRGGDGGGSGSDRIGTDLAAVTCAGRRLPPPLAEQTPHMASLRGSGAGTKVGGGAGQQGQRSLDLALVTPSASHTHTDTAAHTHTQPLSTVGP